MTTLRKIKIIIFYFDKHSMFSKIKCLLKRKRIVHRLNEYTTRINIKRSNAFVKIEFIKCSNTHKTSFSSTTMANDNIMINKCTVAKINIFRDHIQ
jgi:hypothetical protein